MSYFWVMPTDQRQRARTLARQAVARGELARPDACERCHAPGPTEGHHADYSKPLAVTWLCRACHAAEHCSPAQERAAAELQRDPARSDRLIAELTGCEHHAVARARARLEAAGSIEPVPRSARTPRAPNGPAQLGAAQQAVAQLGPDATTRQVMTLSGVGREAAWHARTHPRTAWHAQHDAAAAVDTLSVRKTPAPRARKVKLPPQPLPAGSYAPPAAPGLWCCTAIYRDGRWQHDPGCPVAAR